MADLKRLLIKYPKILLMEDWRFNVGVDDSFHPDDREGNRSYTFATCNVLWEYKDISMTFYRPACAKLDYDDLEETFVHECIHGILNEMREDKKNSRKHEERVVTTFTSIIMRLIRARDEIKKRAKGLAEKRTGGKDKLSE